MSVVELNGLSKQYAQRTVVDNLTLRIEPGECFGLLGPNGAGKTTTLRMLLGLTPPTAGSIRVLGYEVPAQARQMREQVGIVPQFDNLDPDFTVYENLRTYGSYFGLGGSALAQRIDELLEFAQLSERASATIQTLSGGMKRRLTLARALIHRPKLLVLDEPTTGLDPQARQHIWQRLRDLLAAGHSLILTTHYMEEAERLCDRIAIVDHGQLRDCDTPRELIRRYLEPHVLEVHGAVSAAWLTQARALPKVRMESVGSSWLLYGYERDPLLALADCCGSDEYLYRPANLEDVFLKLTGRELRD